MTNGADSLDVSAIAAALGGMAVRFDVGVLDVCDSTNAELMRRTEAGAPSGTVIVAERQTAGRGRRGRVWHSAPGDSLTFSLLWRLPHEAKPDGLSLAVGVALAEALGEDIRVKWPNDILHDGRKLGGILVELTGRAAVIGVGLNLRLPADLPDDLRAIATALAGDIARNDLLARLLAALAVVLGTFGAAGFAPLRERWLARCGHLGATAQLLSDFAPPRLGRCTGVATDGALLVETTAGIERIVSGEISLRPAD